MSHLVLHIGTHKTGTTAIQNVFWRNSAELESNGVIYPRLHRRHSGHHGLIAEAAQLPLAYRLSGGGWDAMKRLADRWKSSDVTLFLSSEEFSRAEEAKAVDFARIAALFSGFDRITALCALRPQWRFLQAIYLEISRNRSPPRPPAMVAEALGHGRCQGLYMDYADLLDRLDRAFGAENIRLVDFEHARCQPGGMIQEALCVAGLNVDGLELKHERANVSGSALPQWAANLLAEPWAASPELVAKIRQTVLGQFGNAETCLLTRNEVAQMRAAFRGANLTVAERMGGRPLTDPELSADCVYREDPGLEFWLHCGRSLARPMVPAACELDQIHSKRPFRATNP